MRPKKKKTVLKLQSAYRWWKAMERVCPEKDLLLILQGNITPESGNVDHAYMHASDVRSREKRVRIDGTLNGFLFLVLAHG